MTTITGIWIDEASDISPEAVERIMGANQISDDPNAPPRRLSIDPNQPTFHPCYCRVGVRVNGIERNDIEYYDQDRLSYMTTDHRSFLAETLEPYWRYQPSRQQRRYEEAWGRKHKK